MRDEGKTKRQLIEELAELQGRLAAAEAAAECSPEPLLDLDRIFYYSLDLLCIAGSDGYYKRVNPAFERILGHTESDSLSRPFLEFVHPDDRSAAADVLRQLNEGEPLICFETRYICKDGSYRWLSWTGVPLPEKGLLYGIGRDITEHKHTEMALHSREQHFRALVETTSDYIWEVDIEGVYTYCSPTVRELLGYDPEDVVGKTPFELMLPEEAQRIEHEFAAKAVVGAPFARLENTCIHADGRKVVLETSGIPIFDATGDHIGYRGIDRDITERKKTEEALKQLRENLEDQVRERTAALTQANKRLNQEIIEHKKTAEELRDREARLHGLLETTFDGIVIHDEGVILEANDAFAEMFGCKRDELIGTNAMHFASPESERVIREKIRHGDAKPYEVVGHRKDGSTIYIEQVGKTCEYQGRTVRIAAFRDISKRKLVEKALRESDETLRALVNAPTEPAVLLDIDGTIVNLNKEAALRLGRPIDQLVGRCCFDFFPTEIAKSRKVWRDQAICTGKPVRFEDQRDGRWFDFNVYPILDEAGKVTRLATFVRDITAEKQSEEATRLEQQHLRQLLDMYERDRKLTAYEIHDGLIQPTTACKMLLETSLGEAESTRSQCNRKRCTEAVNLLAQSITEARRLMSGQRPLILDDMGLLAALECLIDDTAERNGLEIDYTQKVKFRRLPSPLETAVYRVVQESLENAVRHSQSRKCRITLTQHDSRLRVEVEDWGKGFIPGQVHEDRFGLMGIRKRAQLFGGQFTIDSTPGKGTRLSVELPLPVGGTDECAESAL